MNAKLQLALSYWDRGWSVIPVHPNDKRPAIDWKQYQQVSATREQVQRWFTDRPDANIGIVTGLISNLTVVDIDGAEGLHALGAADIVLPPETYIVQTPKGLHFYYRYQPKPHTQAGLLEKVDIRNDGGFVVAAGSTIYGKTYRVHTGKDPFILGDLFNHIERHPSQQTQHSSGNWVSELLQNGSGSGNRNSDIARLCGYMKKLHGSDIVAQIALMYNECRCNPPLPEHEVMTIVRSINSYRSDGGIKWELE
jgi:hypothetical protein